MKATSSVYISTSEEETAAIARDFASSLSGDEKICLIGPLGAGKTAFVRGFVQAFGLSARDVMSPTFTLVRVYGEEQEIYHIDLYRLEKEEEILEAGILDLLQSENMVLIEWADRLQKYYPPESILIRISHRQEDERKIEIIAPHK